MQFLFDRPLSVLDTNFIFIEQIANIAGGKMANPPDVNKIILVSGAIMSITLQATGRIAIYNGSIINVGVR